MITDSLYRSQGQTDEELLRVENLLAELRSRGLDSEVQKLLTQKKRLRPFHVDSNGLFVNRSGKRFRVDNQPQVDFIDSNARYVALISARGGGKSAAGAQKSLRKIMGGQSGAVINPVFEDFKTSTWPEFRDWIPWDHVIKTHRYKANVGWEPHQPFTLAFDNGVVVYCKGLNNPESARGPNINWLWYDEARNDETGLAWQIATASVRIGYEPQAFITTTPVGTFHWIYEFFVKESDEDLIAEFAKTSGGRKLVEIFYTSINANKANLDPAFYIALRKAYKPGTYLYKREVEGKFADEGGALGDRSWFKDRMLNTPPPGYKIKKRIRYWDLAASEKKIAKGKKNDPDETVGTLLSMFELGYLDPNPNVMLGYADPGDTVKQTAFCIEDQVNGFLEWVDIKELILETAIRDGVYVTIWIEQEPGAGGKNQVAEIKLFIKDKLGPAWKVEGHLPEGDKVMRANPWFAEARDGRFFMVIGSWNDGLFLQLDSFPEVPHDDRIDSVSGARHVIAPFRTWKKVVFFHLGYNFKEEGENNEQNVAV